MDPKADNRSIDLSEVAKLVAALEDDLQKVAAGSKDLQALRDEVETLRNVLKSPRPRESWIREGLHSVSSLMKTSIGEAVKDWPYVAEISRILGLP
jgi:hypothetical protein